MTEKERFLARYELEHKKTANVIKAFPGDKCDFCPHERSTSALNLAWLFVLEERMILKALRHEEVLGSGRPAAPAWDTVLAEFDKGHDDVVAELRDPKDADLQGTVKFFSGPKQMTDFPRPVFAHFMLDDQIHHRGQMSVYLRMCGGKVPSIYGPSADEPWT